MLSHLSHEAFECVSVLLQDASAQSGIQIVIVSDIARNIAAGKDLYENESTLCFVDLGGDTCW